MIVDNQFVSCEVWFFKFGEFLSLGTRATCLLTNWNKSMNATQCEVKVSIRIVGEGIGGTMWGILNCFADTPLTIHHVLPHNVFGVVPSIRKIRLHSFPFPVVPLLSNCDKDPIPEALWPLSLSGTSRSASSTPTSWVSRTRRAAQRLRALLQHQPLQL